KIARIVYEETNVGAVSITDDEKILAFVGIGDDHHRPETPISSQSTLDAISQNDIIYLDGKEKAYQCSISPYCKLGSALIIPLRAGDKVIGTIKLYEPKRKLFSTINMSMAEGIAQLLSSQILFGDYQQKRTLLSQAEIKLLHAQVNPHFLFNALNTISAVIRRDPAKARELIQHLSHFFRSNLKQDIDTVTLKEELAHVNAYLTIEKARFTDRLEVNIDIDDTLLNRKLPTFTLQPLVENAIKHGISNLLEGGHVHIYSQNVNGGYQLVVEDNAGSYIAPQDDHAGLGMQIVDKRLTNKFGRLSALKIDVEPNKFTRMSFFIPDENTY
ncbi:MAG: histidine kinase, partial [Vibrionaceae bacterium]|nr:histidine kinase [Vibrionaceae bacterium]